MIDVCCYAVCVSSVHYISCILCVCVIGCMQCPLLSRVGGHNTLSLHPISSSDPYHQLSYPISCASCIMCGTCNPYHQLSYLINYITPCIQYHQVTHIINYPISSTARPRVNSERRGLLKTGLMPHLVVAHRVAHEYIKHLVVAHRVAHRVDATHEYINLVVLTHILLHIVLRIVLMYSCVMCDTYDILLHIVLRIVLMYSCVACHISYVICHILLRISSSLHVSHVICLALLLVYSCVALLSSIAYRLRVYIQHDTYDATW
jgi:hypothetical protein